MSTRLPDDEQPEFQLSAEFQLGGWARLCLDLFIAANLAAGLISLAVRCSVGDDACAALSSWT